MMKSNLAKNYLGTLSTREDKDRQKKIKLDYKNRNIA